MHYLIVQSPRSIGKANLMRLIEKAIQEGKGEPVVPKKNSPHGNIKLINCGTPKKKK